jgi:hypothetical protein
MILALIGPGDIELHYQQFLKIPKEKFNSELKKIAQSLVNSGIELECLPDRGISFQLAKLYKQKGGKKVIATIPKSDKTFGIKHLEPYINEKLNNSPIFNKIIDSGDWFKHDMTKGLFGHAILCLGLSKGTDLERNGAEYLYKLMSGNKKGVEVAGKFIHPEIKADKNFTIFIYSPFLKNKRLSPEDEFYSKHYNVNIVYIQNPKQLEKELIKFQEK